jgi:hypothetical protein
MHGHHVIDDLNYFLTRPINDHLYKEGVRVAVNAIKSAQHFYLGPYEELILPLRAFQEKAKDEPLFLGMCGEHIRLPYKSCWFEFEDKSFIPNETTAVPKRGLLVTELQPRLISVIILNWTQEWRRWTLNPQLYMVSIGKRFGEDPLLRKAITELILSRGGSIELVNSCMAGNIYPMQSMLAMNPKASIEMAKDDQRDLFVLNSALMLLSCKNVITEDHVPSQKLNKKRRKNDKQELFTYKTLLLKLPADKTNRKDVQSHTEEKHRIHLCRGHFKYYDDKAPLFGKHTGLYWWDAHLRGDKNEGLVVKDYSVTPRSDMQGSEIS